MRLGFGIVLVWLGGALLWVAFHGTTATTPWGAVTEITDATSGKAPADDAAPVDAP